MFDSKMMEAPPSMSAKTDTNTAHLETTTLPAMDGYLETTKRLSNDDVSRLCHFTLNMLRNAVKNVPSNKSREENWLAAGITTSTPATDC